jgi:LmbE family N-acetylglucosaminyl deacetylase
MAQTLVAIPAHADDVELNAGGTVAKWAANGGEVHVIMMTDNCSGLKLDPVKTTAKRHEEQEAATALYGGKVHYRNYSQRHYWDEKTNRRINEGYEHDLPAPPGIKGHLPLLIAVGELDHIESLGELILSLTPNLVITQTPLDLNPEHHAVASMVWNVFQLHKEELADVPLWFWTPGTTCQDGMIDPRYDHLEDISDFFEKKLELCAAHASQMNETRWNMVRKRAEYFGSKIGVRYAEPFNIATREIRFA